MGAPTTTSRITAQDLFTVTAVFTAAFTDTQESAVVKIDASTLANTLAGATPLVAIEKVEWNISGTGQVKILFDASSDDLALILSAFGTLNMTDAPMTNNAGSGVTGDILFTTTGMSSGDTYQVILYCRKLSGFTSAPQVTGLTIEDAFSGVYNAGEVLSVMATFDQVVFADGGAGISFNLANDRVVTARYAPHETIDAHDTGDGTVYMLFKYTFTSADAAQAGDMSIGHLTGVRGSSVGALAAVDALTLDTSAFTVNRVDTVQSVSGITNAHAYSTGDHISLTLTYDNAVDVTGTPRIPMHINTTTKQAAYASGSGTTALVFTTAAILGGEVATAGQFSTDAAVDLNGGTIKDHTSGVNASLSFSAPTTTTVTVN